MTTSRMRAVIVLGVALAIASIAVPMAWGIQFHAVGLVQAAVGSALLVSCSSLALNGSRPVPMSARRAGTTVLATTAANAVTPAGVGGTLLTMRVHRRSGLTTEQATAAAGLRSVVGGLTATATTFVVASTVGLEHVPAPSGRTTAYVVGGLLAGLAVIALVMPRARGRVVGATTRTLAAVWDVLRRPRCCAMLVTGCAGVTLAQLLTLQGAVRAVGGHLGWTELLVTLLSSAAARSAVPSPGGVGPIEAALIGGLTALGLPLGTATVAVGVYRTAGHWLPVVAGVLSIRELRRRELL